VKTAKRVASLPHMAMLRDFLYAWNVRSPLSRDFERLLAGRVPASVGPLPAARRRGLFPRREGPKERAPAELLDVGEAWRLMDFAVHGPKVLSAGGRLALVEGFCRVTARVRCLHRGAEMLLLACEALALKGPGCLVEAGCFKGGSTAKLSLVAAAAGRTLYAFDSFRGFPRTSRESTLRGRTIVHRKGMFRGSLREVSDNVARYGRIDRCRFVAGDLRKTMPAFRETVAGAFIDVDQVDSARACLRGLYPRLAPGGFIMSHDGMFSGVVDAFRDKNFWAEMGAPLPDVRGLGTTNILFLRKPRG
jgi:O-methyltransferase